MEPCISSEPPYDSFYMTAFSFLNNGHKINHISLLEFEDEDHQNMIEYWCSYEEGGKVKSVVGTFPISNYYRYRDVKVVPVNCIGVTYIKFYK